MRCATAIDFFFSSHYNIADSCRRRCRQRFIYYTDLAYLPFNFKCVTQISTQRIAFLLNFHFILSHRAYVHSSCSIDDNQSSLLFVKMEKIRYRFLNQAKIKIKLNKHLRVVISLILYSFRIHLNRNTKIKINSIRMRSAH